MDTQRARAIAERLHAGELEEDGTPVIWHVRRVAEVVPVEARAVAWLHEALESTAISERELLLEDLTSDELRVLRLLTRPTESQSDRRYLGHVELIARAAGPSGHLARVVKIADLKDRCVYPHVRRNGWTPPYAQALKLLSEAGDAPRYAVAAGAR